MDGRSSRGFRAAALLLLVPLSCSRPEPVRLGFVGGLTGRISDLGISGRDGATLAVEDRNRAGGVAGRPVELLVRNDDQDAETARRVDRELVSLGAIAIIGHMTSAMSVAALPVAEEARIPLVSPTTTTADLTGRDDQFLRVTASTRDYATHMARHLRRDPGLAAVAVLYELGNRAYTESWVRDFGDAFAAAGGRVVHAATFTSGPEVAFERLAREVLRQPIDGVVLVASATDAAMLAQQVRKLGSTLPLAAAEWASTEKLLELGGGAVEGMLVSQFFDRASTLPRYVAFRDAYRKRFGEEPGFAAVNAYDAVTVVLAAVEGRQEGEPLKEAIVRIGRFEGLQGALAIDRLGDAFRPSRLAVVEKGAFRVVEGP